MASNKRNVFRWGWLTLKSRSMKTIASTKVSGCGGARGCGKFWHQWRLPLWYIFFIGPTWFYTILYEYFLLVAGKSKGGSLRQGPLKLPRFLQAQALRTAGVGLYLCQAWPVVVCCRLGFCRSVCSKRFCFKPVLSWQAWVVNHQSPVAAGLDRLSWLAQRTAYARLSPSLLVKQQLGVNYHMIIRLGFFSCVESGYVGKLSEGWQKGLSEVSGCNEIYSETTLVPYDQWVMVGFSLSKAGG